MRKKFCILLSLCWYSIFVLLIVDHTFYGATAMLKFGCDSITNYTWLDLLEMYIYIYIYIFIFFYLFFIVHLEVIHNIIHNP